MRAAVLSLVVTLLAPLPAFAQTTRPARPNIVIIMADDMGYSDIAPYGGETETPNLQNLAANGVRFTQFYNTARCCPTRAALLTGQYPHRAGVGHMTWKQLDLPGYRSDLSHDTPTVAEVLKSSGYATYMAGKWHVTINDMPDEPKDNWPRQRGFDRYYGTITGSGSYYDPRVLVRENDPISPAGDPGYKPQKYYYTDAVTDHSVQYIREHKQTAADKPFFMYIAYTAPHWPMHAPEEAIAKYKGNYDGGYVPVRAARIERMRAMGLIDSKWEPAGATLAEEWTKQPNKEWEARCMEVYAAMITQMDAGIGKIVGALGEAGQLENTLILFLSDNGGCDEANGRAAGRPKRDTNPPDHKPTDTQWMSRPMVTRDGRPVRSGPKVMPGGDDTFIAYGKNWATVSNTPFREYKHYVHEGGISSPLIAHWPAGMTRRNEWEKQPGHVIDLMATCLDVAHARMPEQFNGKPPAPPAGISLVPALSGKPLARTTPIFFEHEGNRAVRDGKWKLVAKGVKGAWELYDVEADRTESNDLAAKDPERATAMAAQWQAWAEANNVLPLNPWDTAAGAASE
jgi:arylsulfatase